MEDATRLYELEHPGLGRQFRAEVKQAALRIARYPGAWVVEQGEVRKYIMHRFPYKLLYSIEKDSILILAVAHQHRRPDYWVDRKEDAGSEE